MGEGSWNTGGAAATFESRTPVLEGSQWASRAVEPEGGTAWSSLSAAGSGKEGAHAARGIPAGAFELSDILDDAATDDDDAAEGAPDRAFGAAGRASARSLRADGGRWGSQPGEGEPGARAPEDGEGRPPEGPKGIGRQGCPPSPSSQVRAAKSGGGGLSNAKAAGTAAYGAAEKPLALSPVEGAAAASRLTAAGSYAASGAAPAAGASGAAASGGGASAAGPAAVGCSAVALVLGSVLVVLTLLMVLSMGAAGREEDESGFGPMFFWIEYETGLTDDSAFDSVTLDDGLGGQAYGIQFDLYQGSLQEFMRDCLQRDPEAFAPFEALVGLSKGELYATGPLSAMPAAWHMVFNAHKEAFIQAQKDYAIAHFYAPVEKRLTDAGWSIAERAEAVKGSILSYVHQHGVGSLHSTTLASAGIKNADSDEDFIKKLYAYRTEKYGHYKGLDLEARYNREVQTALSMLYSADGGDKDVVGRAQGKIGKVTYTWGGCSESNMDCSGFVSYCLTGEYRRLGTTKTFLTWPKTSAPVPGDVCVDDQHCGIYIGNGKMIDCGNSGVHVSDVWSSMVYVTYPGKR